MHKSRQMSLKKECEFKATISDFLAEILINSYWTNFYWSKIKKKKTINLFWGLTYSVGGPCVVNVLLGMTVPVGTGGYWGFKNAKHEGEGETKENKLLFVASLRRHSALYDHSYCSISLSSHSHSHSRSITRRGYES